MRILYELDPTIDHMTETTPYLLLMDMPELTCSFILNVDVQENDVDGAEKAVCKFLDAMPAGTRIHGVENEALEERRKRFVKAAKKYGLGPECWLRRVALDGKRHRLDGVFHGRIKQIETRPHKYRVMVSNTDTNRCCMCSVEEIVEAIKNEQIGVTTE